MSSVDPNLPLGVCVFARAPENKAQPVNYPEYIFEILSHSGLCFARVAPENLLEILPRLKILVTVGEQALGEALAQQLAAWVRAGGGWLSVGGVCGMSSML